MFNIKSKLFNTNLVIERHTGGSKDSNNNYVDNPPEIISDGWFNIQPFRFGNQEVRLPDGIRSTDAYIVRGSTPIVAADPFDGIKGDKTTIKGKSYIANSTEDWTFHGGKTSHYKSIFIREDRLSQRTQ